MLENLLLSNSEKKPPIIPKPDELLGNYEVIDLPEGPKGRGVGGSWVREDKMFIVGGNDGALNPYYDDVWSLDLNQFTWVKKNNFPTKVNGPGSLYQPFVDKGLIIGGTSNSSTYLNKMWSYDHATDQWSSHDLKGVYTNGTYLPGFTLRGDNAVAVVGGLSTSGHLDAIMLGNVQLMNWNNPISGAIPSTISNKSMLAAVTLDNDPYNVYIRDRSSIYKMNTLQDLNFKLDATWSDANPYNCLKMFDFGGNLWFVTRFPDPNISCLVKYDTTNKTFTKYPNLPIMVQHSMIEYYNGALWLWGGSSILGSGGFNTKLIKIT